MIKFMEENKNTEGIQLPIAQISATEAIQGTGVQNSTKAIIYPTVEEMTFRAIINSEEEGYALLRAVQILVNSLGAPTIIKVMTAVEKNPRLLEQAKIYLPYIGI